jgi:hypothetical protein
MTDLDLQNELLALMRTHNLNTSIFPNYGSIRNVAMLCAGLSCSRTLFTSEIQNTWDRHYAASKWMMHFNDSPGSICSSLFVGLLHELDPDSLRYKDIVRSTALIPNVTVPKTLEHLEAYLRDPDYIPSVLLQNILLVQDCASLAMSINSITPEYVLIMKGMPYNQRDDLIDHRKRNMAFSQAHPVLLSIHAELMDVYRRTLNGE